MIDDALFLANLLRAGQLVGKLVELCSLTLNQGNEPCGEGEARRRTERELASRVHDRRDLDVEEKSLGHPYYPSLHADPEIRGPLLECEFGPPPRALDRLVQAHRLNLHSCSEVYLLELGATEETSEGFPDAFCLRKVLRTNRHDGPSNRSDNPPGHSMTP